MDFRQNLQQAGPTRPDAGNVPVNNSIKQPAKTSAFKIPNWLSLLSAVALIGATLLILAAAFALTRGQDVAKESEYVKTGQYQAVFLNNGQVYFGKVSALNSRFVNLQNVYYLTQATTANNQANSDYTLVKLGCQQIHYPEDQMVISRDQVTFWENLDKDGKVAKSIEEFKKQNPNGEECKQAATQTQSPATNVPSQSGTPSTQSTQQNNSGN